MTFASISDWGTPAILGPKPMFFETFIHSNNAPCWNTMPRELSGPMTRVSPRVISPKVGAKKPARILRSVVLPQPEGPRTDINSPFSIERLMFFNAST